MITAPSILVAGVPKAGALKIRYQQWLQSAEATIASPDLHDLEATPEEIQGLMDLIVVTHARVVAMEQEVTARVEEEAASGPEQEAAEGGDAEEEGAEEESMEVEGVGEAASGVEESGENAPEVGVKKEVVMATRSRSSAASRRPQLPKPVVIVPAPPPRQGLSTTPSRAEGKKVARVVDESDSDIVHVDAPAETVLMVPACGECVKAGLECRKVAAGKARSCTRCVIRRGKCSPAVEVGGKIGNVRVETAQWPGADALLSKMGALKVPQVVDYALGLLRDLQVVITHLQDRTPDPSVADAGVHVSGATRVLRWEFGSGQRRGSGMSESAGDDGEYDDGDGEETEGGTEDRSEAGTHASGSSRTRRRK
ncbi:hypothetical protein BOTBODRAFT_181175 [Botryobasidium botryosum FD-172 SS1]|uniref:Uncharacterized protein n=1 Tax=Botryobasidium botryosum (strain FD-172 SS1) TaxID=930990 RepID=A0A067LUC4_BOTB1|nr:hypothetical protein BOTBODRAFT_181175 [Botryobasidium botryosum FD-172 SS1]